MTDRQAGRQAGRKRKNPKCREGPLTLAIANLTSITTTTTTPTYRELIRSVQSLYQMSTVAPGYEFKKPIRDKVQNLNQIPK